MCVCVCVLVVQGCVSASALKILVFVKRYIINFLTPRKTVKNLINQTGSLAMQRMRNTSVSDLHFRYLTDKVSASGIGALAVKINDCL